MIAEALLVIPPLLKIARGPLLGPAMLLGAAHRAGHRMMVLDLNAMWLQPRLQRRFVGDHDRPVSLRELQADFSRSLGLSSERERHDEVYAGADAIARSAFGDWCSARLPAIEKRPDVVGVSVMYREQVEPALAISQLVQERWPGVPVVWGGAHVTALQSEIIRDARYGERIDGFAFGYAEQTWVDLLDSIAARKPWPAEIVRAGSEVALRAREDASVVPVFDRLDIYQPERLTLPLQTSRGCSYGHCKFCTYPGVEGEYREVAWEVTDRAVAEAIRVGALISFKDSLLGGARLERLANLIGGRVRWSACTKLDARLPGRLARLAQGGCSTLEIGLETVEPDAQRLVGKKQRWSVFLEFLDAAEREGIAVVVNYITGLPNADSKAERECQTRVEAELARRPRLNAKLEHNTFQLERCSPMGKDPEAYGMRITRSVPWSTTMEWSSVTPLIQLGGRHR